MCSAFVPGDQSAKESWPLNAKDFPAKRNEPRAFRTISDSNHFDNESSYDSQFSKILRNANIMQLKSILYIKVYLRHFIRMIQSFSIVTFIEKIYFSHVK